LIGIRFFKDQDAGKTVYAGNLILLPTFPVTYSLKIALPGGVEKGMAFEQGAALEAILTGEKQRLRQHGQTDLSIAARQYDLYQLAKTRLPYGISEITLPSDADWSISGQHPDGEPYSLSTDKPTSIGTVSQISASWRPLPEINGQKNVRLSVVVKPIPAVPGY